MKWYCEDCERTFDDSDPRLEDRSHDGYPRCPICGRNLEPAEEDDAEESGKEDDE